MKKKRQGSIDRLRSRGQLPNPTERSKEGFSVDATAAAEHEFELNQKPLSGRYLGALASSNASGISNPRRKRPAAWSVAASSAPVAAYATSPCACRPNRNGAMFSVCDWSKMLRRMLQRHSTAICCERGQADQIQIC